LTVHLQHVDSTTVVALVPWKAGAEGVGIHVDDDFLVERSGDSVPKNFKSGVINWPAPIMPILCRRRLVVSLSFASRCIGPSSLRPAV
jgi:hypothetical protein